VKSPWCRMSARRSSGARPSCVYGTEKSGLGQGGHERKQRGAERHGRLSGELAGQVPRGEHDGAPARHAVCDAAGLGIVDVDRIVDMGLFGGELDRTLDITAHVADDPQERRGGSVVEPAYRRLRHQARVRLVPEHAVEEHGQARQPAVEHALVQLRMCRYSSSSKGAVVSRRATISCSANTTLCTARRVTGPANRPSRSAGATAMASSASTTS